MPDTQRESARTEFQAWQARALNTLLVILTIAATPVVISTTIEAIRFPGAGCGGAAVCGPLRLFNSFDPSSSDSLSDTALRFYDRRLLGGDNRLSARRTGRGWTSLSADPSPAWH